jgi:hypothetical protein
MIVINIVTGISAFVFSISYGVNWDEIKLDIIKNNRLKEDFIFNKSQDNLKEVNDKLNLLIKENLKLNIDNNNLKKELNRKYFINI